MELGFCGFPNAGFSCKVCSRAMAPSDHLPVEVARKQKEHRLWSAMPTLMLGMEEDGTRESKLRELVVFILFLLPACHKHAGIEDSLGQYIFSSLFSIFSAFTA